METKILIGRKLKSVFIRMRLHHLMRPLSGPFIKLGYMAGLSRWVSEHSPLEFHDAADRGHRAEKRYDLYRFVFEREGLAGPMDYLEFGVGMGRWFRFWVENNPHPDSRFVGFDTFTGLPERWEGYAEGAFSRSGQTPDIEDPRCSWEAGLFQDTLGVFLKTYQRQDRLVVHLDADLYSSTIYVLTTLFPFLRPGDVLIFDEFGVPTHEFRAWHDFCSGFRVEYEALGAVNNYLHVALKLTSIGGVSGNGDG